MLIDFTKLKDLIPASGCVTLTIKPAKDNTLGVLYSVKHSLSKVESTYEKTLEDDKKAIEKASQKLSKVVAFNGTPEELTKTFEEKITQSYATEKALADVINERTAELNACIKDLKAKKDVKKPAAKPGATAAASPKKEEKKKEEPKPEKKSVPALGGLFGSINTEGCSTGSAGGTKAEEAETGAEETGAEETEAGLEENEEVHEEEREAA
jgi:hypothetical protein